MRSQMSVSEFTNEKPGNLVHWRIVHNLYAEQHGEPPYFVYRVVEGRAGKPETEYLTRTGEVDDTSANGHFANYAEVGMALILNHGRESAAGTSGFYTPEYLARQGGQNPRSSCGGTS
jgi:hypothetical protein